MFESLTSRLTGIFSDLRQKGLLSEENIDVVLREIRMAFLEADVNFNVAKKFIEKVREKLIGVQKAAHLDPSQQVIKAVKEELIDLMGVKSAPFKRVEFGPTVILLVGLQGSGKTTTAAKVAKSFKEKGMRVLLVPADLARPAAVKQLKVLSQQAEVDFFDPIDFKSPVPLVKHALEDGKKGHYDYCIIDSSGRLSDDDDLMGELQEIHEISEPDESILVVDSMAGQDAVSVGESFSNRIDLTGVIFTKFDGDSRGGAVLSIRSITNLPVRFVGVGEKIADIEAFDPEKMASRILGMGDIFSLIEKAEASVPIENMEKFSDDVFNLQTMKEQLKQMKKVGSINDMLSSLPGIPSKIKDVDFDEKQIYRNIAIIDSMTPKERISPEIIKGSRRKRIANGSGVLVQDVNRLLKQFIQTRKIMGKFSKAKNKDKLGFVKKMFKS